jgi:predicted amidohydrolase
VATIVGFSETPTAGHLYNAAAVFHRGAVAGVHRKVHPAIRTSVYHPGGPAPVFRIGGLTFGILICNDSNFPELARSMAARGATARFSSPPTTGFPRNGRMSRITRGGWMSPWRGRTAYR